MEATDESAAEQYCGKKQIVMTEPYEKQLN